jgi:mono/diheme cytochrome c family protein
MRRTGSLIFLLILGALGGGLLLALAGCAEEEDPLSLAGADAGAGTDASTIAETPSKGVRVCTQTHAEALPARLVAMSTSAPTSGNTILASDLFQTFNEVCSPCHTAASDPPGQGGFQIAKPGDFASKMTQQVLDHVTHAVCPSPVDSTNPYEAMPPCSSQAGSAYPSYAARPTGDAIKAFATVVQAWLDAGAPAVFTESTTSASAAPDGGADAAPATSYALSPANGNAMTNLGNCVPSPALMGVQETKAAALDTLFAAAHAEKSGTPEQIIGLPANLSDTDLFTLDSSVLAQYGVIAYAPGYPLWSDNAGKLRYVRVPRGQSIHFNKTTQQFEIPPNTRFYKTFMKQIIDTDGSYRYRKIETRLIVSRPDTNNPDGTAMAQTALYGSYKWDPNDESKATLITTQLHDGLPFGDTILLYNTNEPLAADILNGQPTDPANALLLSNAARHYAIPSSQRCVQCHMGSPSQSFVLGFTPLQINRMPTGTHGVIEETGPDELTQLQRLIDAGVITGVDSPADLLPLEQSQGTRTPRNREELLAQGYLLGNCSHCHNPRGYPTVQNPILSNVLDFLPAAGPLGGIFQFPLERTSPRIERGVSGSTPIPYITPSLVDLPRSDPGTGGPEADPFVQAPDPAWIDYAPWRSIIYRNVDSPFAYADDNALFPHMPMNTPGYDPRAKQILGDWMVSIPAARKHPELVEYAYQTGLKAQQNIGSPVVDTSPQPYAEVLPGDPGYAAALTAAQQRLAIFHTGVNPAVPLNGSGTPYSRYADPGRTEDILDPQVEGDPVCHPVPTANVPQYHNPLPEHPHWVTTDLTQAPGMWQPRGSLWPSVLVRRDPPSSSSCTFGPSQAAAYDDQLKAIDLLQTAALDQVSDFVLKPQPFGLWQQQPGCTFPAATAPPVSSFVGTARPHWMDVVNPAADAPVYMQAPGASVFKMICINCHGPNADSNGRLAQNLATMTGGNALVADFKHGLFGPPGATADTNNRHAVFNPLALSADLDAPVPMPWLQADDGTTLGDDDRAARYMAWMGLGGTSVNIPVPVLQIVAITKVLDQQRTLDPSQLSANMLSQAKALCLSLLGPPGFGTSPPYLDPRPGHAYLDAKVTLLNPTLIPENGDAELWLSLCSLHNPPPVRVVTFAGTIDDTLDVSPINNTSHDFQITSGSLIAPSAYPPDAPVGDATGAVLPSLTPDNPWPWCVGDTLPGKTATAAQEKFLDASNIPRCPQKSIDALNACIQSDTCYGNDDVNRWAVRGAINAGMAVFTYVRSIENSSPPPDYNQCSLLK